MQSIFLGTGVTECITLSSHNKLKDQLDTLHSNLQSQIHKQTIYDQIISAFLFRYAAKKVFTEVPQSSLPKILANIVKKIT